MSFAQLRSQAVQLEKQTESHLGRLSAASTPEEEQALQSLLDRRQELLTQLNKTYESAGTTVSATKSQQLNRHSEILNDHTRSFLQLKSRIQEERNRNDLLYSIQSDITQHKQRQNGQNGQAEGDTNPNDYILDERQRVDGANSLADRLLQQAFATRDELLSQRQYLDNAQSRILGTIQQIPGINVLISKINTRRRRDTLILATVIAVCIVILFFV